MTATTEENSGGEDSNSKSSDAGQMVEEGKQKEMMENDAGSTAAAAAAASIPNGPDKGNDLGMEEGTSSISSDDEAMDELAIDKWREETMEIAVPNVMEGRVFMMATLSEDEDGDNCVTLDSLTSCLVDGKDDEGASTMDSDEDESVAAKVGDGSLDIEKGADSRSNNGKGEEGEEEEEIGGGKESDNGENGVVGERTSSGGKGGRDNDEAKDCGSEDATSDNINKDNAAGENCHSSDKDKTSSETTTSCQVENPEVEPPPPSNIIMDLDDNNKVGNTTADNNINNNTTTTTNCGGDKGGNLGKGDESDEDRPTIFIRNFAEIAEPDSSDEDDIVILDSTFSEEPSRKRMRHEESSRKEPNAVKTYGGKFPTNKPKIPHTKITFDDKLADLEMSIESPLDVNTSRTNAARLADYHKAKTGFLRIKKALTDLKNAKNTDSRGQIIRNAINVNKPGIQMAPITMTPSYPQRAPPPVQRTRFNMPSTSVVQNAVRQMQFSTSQPQMNQTPAILRMPNLSPIIISNFQTPGTASQLAMSGIRIQTNTNVSTASSGPRVATTVGNNQPANTILNVQQMPQLIFDPSTGLLLCPSNQVIRTQLNTAQQPRVSSPSNTIRLQNGMVLSGSPGNQLLNVQHAIPPHQVQVQRVASPVRQNSPMPVVRQQLMQRATSQPIRHTAPPIRQVGPMRQVTPVRQVMPVRQVVPVRQAVPAPVRHQFQQQQQHQNQLNMPRLPQQTQTNMIRPPVRAPTPTPLTNSAPRLNGSPLLPIKPAAIIPSSSGVAAAEMPGVTAGNQKPIPGTVEEKEIDLQNKTFPSLVVHVKICLRPKLARPVQVKARADLDLAVKAVLIHSPAKFCEWLMRRGLIRLEHACDLPAHRFGYPPYKLGMYSEVAKQPFSGGYVWISECCQNKNISVFTGSIFEGSKYPPGTVLKLIYHWACQTPASNVLQWVKVTSFFLKNFFTLLRAVCTTWLHEHCPLLGGELKFVEIGVITLGSSAETSRGVKNVNVEILGVFDPSTKIVRMKVINSLQSLFKDKGKKADANEQGARAFQILWPLTHWVDKRSILLVDGIIDKALFHELGFKNVQQCGENLMRNAPTNSNVMNYLRHVVPKMFSSTLSVLSKSIVQQFLDELSWRETYGQNVLQSYENMLDHVAAITKWNFGEPLINRLNKINQNPFADWSYTKQVRRSPQNTIPITLRNEPGIRECIRHLMKDEAKNPVPPAALPPILPPPPKPVQQPLPAATSSGAQKRKLSETTNSNTSYYKNFYATAPRKELSLQKFYYGHIGAEAPKPWSKSVFSQNLKCPLCVRTFTSNREIIRHIIVHVASLGRGSENFLCNYCLKEEGSAQGLQQHIRDTHTLTGVKYRCRICQDSFPNEEELVIHMWHFHVEAESPYTCDVCCYSSSFHYEIIDHFFQAHAGIGYVMCPYCLKVLSAKSFAFLKTIVVHLQSHQLRRTKKCERCVLSFGNDIDLRNHLTAHLSNTTAGSLWLRYEASEEENIMMAIPPTSRLPPIKSLMSAAIPPAKRQKLNSEKKKASDSKSTLNTSFSVPINTNERYGGSKYKMNIPITEKGKAICAECSKDVAIPNHFIGRLKCTKCRYVTACQAAMDAHHQRNHLPNSDRIKPGMPTSSPGTLKEPLVCKCGFMSLNPFKLAQHLIRCEKITVYPKNRTPLYTEVMGTEKPPTLPLQQGAAAAAAAAAAPLPGTSAPSSSSKPVPSPSPTDLDLDDIFSTPSMSFSMSSTEVALSLPPVLSPSAPMPQSPLTAFDNAPGSPPLPPPPATNHDNVDAANTNWDPQTNGWELPISGLIAKCS